MEPPRRRSLATAPRWPRRRVSLGACTFRSAPSRFVSVIHRCLVIFSLRSHAQRGPRLRQVPPRRLYLKPAYSLSGGRIRPRLQPLRASLNRCFVMNIRTPSSRRKCKPAQSRSRCGPRPRAPSRRSFDALTVAMSSSPCRKPSRPRPRIFSPVDSKSVNAGSLSLNPVTRDLLSATCSNLRARSRMIRWLCRRVWPPPRNSSSGAGPSFHGTTVTRSAWAARSPSNDYSEALRRPSPPVSVHLPERRRSLSPGCISKGCSGQSIPTENAPNHVPWRPATTIAHPPGSRLARQWVSARGQLRPGRRLIRKHAPWHTDSAARLKPASTREEDRCRPAFEVPRRPGGVGVTSECHCRGTHPLPGHGSPIIISPSPPTSQTS